MAKINEVYGVTLNGFWIEKSQYSDAEIKMKDNPDKMYNFKDAYNLAKEVSGDVMSFAPRKLEQDELNTLHDAVFGSEDD